MESTNLGGMEEKTWEKEVEEVDRKNGNMGRQFVIFVLGVILGLALKSYASSIGWTMGAEDYKQSELTSDFDFSERRENQEEEQDNDQDVATELTEKASGSVELEEK